MGTTPELPRKGPPKNLSSRPGGHKKLRLFTFHLFEGCSPVEAFHKAGFPVVGVLGPGGEVCTKGTLPGDVERRAKRLAQKPRVRAWLADWSVPPEARLHNLQTDSIGVLQMSLLGRDDRGMPTARALQAADSILDRTGLGRGTKVSHDLKLQLQPIEQDESLRQKVLEAMRGDPGVIEAFASRSLPEGTPQGGDDAQ